MMMCVYIRIMGLKGTGRLGTKAAEAIVRQLHFGQVYAARKILNIQMIR